MNYYCWLQYYDEDTKKQINSEHISFYDGHQHGVKPTQEDWNNCLDDLVSKVNQNRMASGFSELSKESIWKSAEQKTRSGH